MITLLCAEDIIFVLPFVFMALFITVVAVVAVVAVAKSKKRRQSLDEYKATHQYYTDGDGLTDYQREFLKEKRRQRSGRNVTASDGSHTHKGKEEKYDKIVGSLGEVNDEGCDELDGIRLIEHDESYCDDPNHIIETDNEELIRAMVLGEAVNNPRFKQMYKRK